ncbi:MAG: hypothetical protein U0234_12610 [Sandaracinus sp.]
MSRSALLSSSAPRVALSVLVALLASCDGGGRAAGWRRTPDGTGPRVAWDVLAQPLPTIPLPNDVATWPDPTSPTGLRLNASQIVPTQLEATTRAHFDELDGWGTFAPISIPFDAPLDLEDLVARQGGTDHFHTSSFPAHAIYLIDMTTGLPMLLDVGTGDFPAAVVRPDAYFDNDPRNGESNLLLETVEEDLNRNGRLDPGEDTDFDGVLDHPATIDGRLGRTPTETYDRMTWFYERETNTLLLRPILPLEQRHTYAVVVTDRLHGEDGAPVRSSLEYVHPIQQTQALAALPRLLEDHADLYGDLATDTWSHVAFAWTFTTQSVTTDLDALRDGLYGRGPFERLANEFPPNVAPAPVQGGQGCRMDLIGNVYTAPGERLREVLQSAGGAVFGLSEDGVAALVESYQSLDHISVAFFEVPYFFTDPEHEELDDAWDLDAQTGRARMTREVVSMLTFVPRDTSAHQQPFAPLVYVHGHGSNSAEVLVYAGLFVQQGQAVVAVNAHGHGLSVDRATNAVLHSLFGQQCVGPLVDALLAGRARDLDGDGSVDSGVDFWTSYVFHTRDSVRQTVVDQMQAIRILRSFDGTRRAAPISLVNSAGATLDFDGDVNGDGQPDLAGDFDGNGVPDLGGAQEIRFAGGSLGGIITGVMQGVEPAIGVAAAVVPGGGLADVALRTENGSVLPAMILRVIGPLVAGRVSTGPGRESACAAGDVSLYAVVPSLDNTVRTEIACLPGAEAANDDVLFVRNLDNGEVSCSGTTGGAIGAFRVPIPSDAGDRWTIELYHHATDRIHFGDCRWLGNPPAAPDRVIDTWESGNGSGAGNCAQCGKFEQTEWHVGDPLVAPAAGFGLRRQTPDFRRLMSLAQIGLERGDPINFQRRLFLDPITAPDVPDHVRSSMMAMTTGDPNVVIATGYSLARAAGVEAFLPPDAPDHLAEFRAPASFATEHPGFATPNDLALGYHAIEAVPRLERHPVPGGPTFLADIDDLSDGLLYFAGDGETQLPPDMGGVQPVRASPPLRWSRLSRPMARPGDDEVWRYHPGERTSVVVSLYVIPNGIHGFNTFFDPSLGFDSAVYSFNLLSRYLATSGEDVPYLSDPAGHHCLESSTCPYLHPGQ